MCNAGGPEAASGQAAVLLHKEKSRKDTDLLEGHGNDPRAGMPPSKDRLCSWRREGSGETYSSLSASQGAVGKKGADYLAGSVVMRQGNGFRLKEGRFRMGIRKMFT